MLCFWVHQPRPTSPHLWIKSRDYTSSEQFKLNTPRIEIEPFDNVLGWLHGLSWFKVAHLVNLAFDNVLSWSICQLQRNNILLQTSNMSPCAPLSFNCKDIIRFFYYLLNVVQGARKFTNIIFQGSSIGSPECWLQRYTWVFNKFPMCFHGLFWVNITKKLKQWHFLCFHGLTWVN